VRIRTAAAALLVACALAATTGCTPQGSVEPTSIPTPTFTSDAQAFAAAEATYRAYVDALNKVDLSDPATFEPVYAWTTGDANAEDRKSFSQMHAEGLTVSGQSVATLIRSHRVGSTASAPRLDVCLDVSGVTLVDPSGKSAIDPDRVDVQKMRVTLRTADSPTGLRISRFEGRDGTPECDP
jgi:hypothetical protein